MKTKNGTESDSDEITELFQLPCDMRRMLRVQLKEFIHTIEDSECALKQPSEVRSQTGPINARAA